jgi:quinol monooxygenase YgiN
MPRKNKGKTKSRKSKALEVNAKAAKILRSVREEEAFYFYEDFGKPTGESARSLSEFLEKVKSAKLESLVFHLQRKDFQNWIAKIIGDPKLARRIGKIYPSCSEELREEIEATIENHIHELRGAFTTLSVSEDLVLASSTAP